MMNEFLEPGSFVRHPERPDWGLGQVQSVIAARITVNFENAGKVVTRTMLLEEVWDYHFDPQTNVIDVHISRLRSKIDKDFDRPLLHTVRGSGYILRDSGEGAGPDASNGAK